MPSLTARKALAGRSAIVTGGHELRERRDIAAVLVTARAALELPEAIVRGPHEWLLLGNDANVLITRAEQAVAGVTSLINDMSDGFAFIELTGPDTVGLLGIAPLAKAATGAITTRIADLRITVRYAGGDTPSALLIVERSSAGYFWEWLADRLSLGDTTNVGTAI